MHRWVVRIWLFVHIAKLLILLDILIDAVILYLIICVVFILTDVLAIAAGNVLIIAFKNHLSIAESVGLILLIMKVAEILNSKVVFLFYVYLADNLRLVHIEL